MNKFKKMMSVTLASCMAASALMMSAGAANTPVDTGTATLAPNVISNTTINQLKATAQNAIEQFFRESDKDLYSLVGFRFDDGEVTQSDGSVQYKTTVTVSELKHRALKKCRTSLAIWMNSALLRMPQWPHPIRRSWQNPLSA